MKVTIGIMGTGEFGREVCARLVDYELSNLLILQREMFGSAATRLPVKQLGLSGVVFVMWRPSDADCEAVDEFAFDAGVPWFPVVLDQPYLRVGPWLVPPEGPCFQCLRTRLLQHTADISRRTKIREAYDADPKWGGYGHLPAHVQLACGLIQKAAGDMVDLGCRMANKPGIRDALEELVRYDFMNGGFSRHRLVPCHGCPRCHRVAQGPAGGKLLECVDVGEPKGEWR